MKSIRSKISSPELSSGKSVKCLLCAMSILGQNFDRNNVFRAAQKVRGGGSKY